MTGYEIYCFCRRVVGWNQPSLDTYLASSEKPYYEMLSNYILQRRNLTTEQTYEFIRAVFNADKATFDPFKLVTDEAWNAYMEWRKTLSTKGLYFEQIRKSFTLIENCCINNCIDLEQYKKEFALRHIRENKIDAAVAVHLQLVDIKKLTKVQKILLKSFLKEYNIIKIRLDTPELQQLLNELTMGMKNLLHQYEVQSKNK